MQTRNLTNTVLLTVIACLLVWSVADSRPAAFAAPASDAGMEAEAETEATGSISVTGSSAIRVPPDRVVVVFGVETFAQTPRASRLQNARLSAKVLNAIGAQGIAEGDIATADFSIQPRYEDYDRHIISGYASLSTIAVTLRDVEKLEAVLVVALEAGATTVDGIEFSVTNLRQLRDRAREMAVQAALEKAADMAAAADMAVVGVTSIHEDAWQSGYFGWWRGNRQWTNTQNVVQDLAGEGALTLEDGSINLGKIVVRAQVSLSAGIAPAR